MLCAHKFCSVYALKYRNAETVTTALHAIAQGYGGIEKIFGCEDGSIRRIGYGGIEKIFGCEDGSIRRIYPKDNER